MSQNPRTLGAYDAEADEFVAGDLVIQPDGTVLWDSESGEVPREAVAVPALEEIQDSDAAALYIRQSSNLPSDPPTDALAVVTDREEIQRYNGSGWDVEGSVDAGGADVSDDGSLVESSPTDIDMATALTATSDGDGTATVDVERETVEDWVASLVTSAGNVSVSYDDANNSLMVSLDDPVVDVQVGTDTTRKDVYGATGDFNSVSTEQAAVDDPGPKWSLESPDGSTLEFVSDSGDPRARVAPFVNGGGVTWTGDDTDFLFTLFRTGTSGNGTSAASLGSYRFEAEDSSGGGETFARFVGLGRNFNDGAEVGDLQARVLADGSETTPLKVRGRLGGSLDFDAPTRHTDVNREVLNSNVFLPDDAAPVQNYDPDGSTQAVDLPGAGEFRRLLIGNHGNSGADIKIEDGGTTLVTISNGDAALCQSDGTGWIVLSGTGAAT